jgi:hypothetical protein
MWLRWRSRGELVSSHHADRIMRPARRPLEGCGPRPARRFGRARAGTRVSRGCRHRDGSVPRCGRRLRLPRGQRSGSRGSEPLGDRLRQQRQADTRGHGEKHVLHAGSGTSTNVGASPALWHIATIALLNAGLTSRGSTTSRSGASRSRAIAEATAWGWVAGSTATARRSPSGATRRPVVGARRLAMTASSRRSRTSSISRSEGPVVRSRWPRGAEPASRRSARGTLAGSESGR